MGMNTEFQATDADFQTVREVVYEHCGISLSVDKASMVRARLAKQIRSGGFNSAGDYLKYALADRKSQAFAGLIDAITTNLTSFYRESDHFKFLSKVALPAAIKKKIETGDNRLLLWSAACSSGEEPYTLAMPAQFTAAFAGRLNKMCQVEVCEASDGDSVLPVRVLIAPGGFHTVLRRSGSRYYVEINDGPEVHHQKPAVDNLFQSFARHAGANAVGAILTGMGADGATGLLAMRKAGAATIAQDEKSCTVFGMPMEAIKCGGAEHVLPLEAVASTMIRLARTDGRPIQSPEVKTIES